MMDSGGKAHWDFCKGLTMADQKKYFQSKGEKAPAPIVAARRCDPVTMPTKKTFGPALGGDRTGGALALCGVDCTDTGLILGPWG